MPWTDQREQENLRKIILDLDLCDCGSASQWSVVEMLLERAADESKSFYEPTDDTSGWWVEFGAKVLDSSGLVEHGSGIGWAWLTDDGELLLQFLKEFGTESEKWPEWAEGEVVEPGAEATVVQ
jgi:hypothetical protein